MAAGLILEFEGVTEKEYNAVNAALGLDYFDSAAAGQDLRTASALLGLRYDF